MLFADDFLLGSHTSLLSYHEPSVVRTPLAVLKAASSYVCATVSSLVSDFGHVDGAGFSCCVADAVCGVATDHVMGLIDSGANVHILSYEAALKLLEDAAESYLKVLGVNGASTRADVQGRLVVELLGSSGRKYNLDLGTAHGMKNCPMNLLSLSLLLDVGAVLHFEKGNCWI